MFLYYNSSMNRIYTSKSLDKAKDLRTNQTNCENILWQYLRAKRLDNIKFRRQVPISKYIVDFVNLGKKLVIELDGSQHLEKDNQKHDNIRTQYLTSLGYKVIRFLDSDVLNNIEEVLNIILLEYNKL